MFGLKTDWSLDVLPRYFTLEDYEGGVARWCPGCGDHGVLTAVQRICRDEQLLPEQTVCVSGIGCSSRFPHYMKTYGFHGLHGRRCPVACGVKARRPELKIWVATGDGDCCSIGAGHWVHAIRYNMDMVVMLFDNAVYGLTKNQTSPDHPAGFQDQHPPARARGCRRSTPADDAELLERVVRGADRGLEPGAPARDAEGGVQPPGHSASCASCSAAPPTRTTCTPRSRRTRIGSSSWSTSAACPRPPACSGCTASA
jgi:hypothetical protein